MTRIAALLLLPLAAARSTLAAIGTLSGFCEVASLACWPGIPPQCNIED